MIEANISLHDFENSAGILLVASKWMLIDQQRINDFADATNDHQFIHVDVERAASEGGFSRSHHNYFSRHQ